MVAGTAHPYPEQPPLILKHEGCTSPVRPTDPARNPYNCGVPPAVIHPGQTSETGCGVLDDVHMESLARWNFAWVFYSRLDEVRHGRARMMKSKSGCGADKGADG